MKFIMSIKEWCFKNNIEIKLWGLVTELDLVSNYKYIDNQIYIFSDNDNVYMSADEIIKVCLENKIKLYGQVGVTYLKKHHLVKL